MNDDEPIDKRYFIVYFSGTNKENKLRKGKIHMYTDNGCYVNENHIHMTIEREFGLTDPYVSRVEELDEEDFMDFISIDEEPKSTVDHTEFL
jgi:hypothetical protein